MARNLKLWNHWIAEVRDIAVKSKLLIGDDDGENEAKPFTYSNAKYIFDKDLMFSHFEEGKTPEESFYDEINEWTD